MEIDSHLGHLFLDEHGALALDQECKHCGYNLRGLREDGRCPECGTAIGLSTRGDLLRFADPDWVGRVALGLAIILWMMLLGAIVGALAGALGIVSQAGSALLSLGSGLVAYYGVWLVTTPDPGGVGEDPNLTARKVVRITLVVGLIGQFALVSVQTGASGLGWPMVTVPVIIVAVLISFVGEFAKFIYYEKLALRIPDYSLAERARLVRWGYTAAGAVMAVGGGLMLHPTFRPGPTGTAPGAGFYGVACAVGVAALAMLVFAVMTLFLLVRLRRSIAAQARLARQTWAAG